MPPASRPAFSCALPRVADTSLLVSGVKLNGSAPYLSSRASRLADVSLNDPEIWVAPPLIVSRLYGDDTTAPSRVKATKSAQGEPLGPHDSSAPAGRSWPPVLCLPV